MSTVEFLQKELEKVINIERPNEASESYSYVSCQLRAEEAVIRGLINTAITQLDTT